MAGKRVTTYRVTEGWEEALVAATSTVERVVAKGTQQGEFTFGNRRDVRHYADRLRKAADRLDAMHGTFSTPTSRPERFL